MSGPRHLSQPGESREVDAPRAQGPVDRPLESYPPVLFVRHLAEIYGRSVYRIHALVREGHFDFAILKPAARLEFSRERIADHLAGRDMRGLTAVRKRA